MERPLSTSKIAKTQQPVQSEPSIRHLVTQLLEIEHELELFSWEVNGVTPWAIMRMSVYYRLTRQLGLFGAPHGTSRWQGRRWRRMALWTRAAFTALFKPRKKCPLLIFDHPRKVYVDDQWVDVYTQGLIKQFNDLDPQIPFAVYEYLSYQNETHANRDYPRLYSDFMISVGRKLADFWYLRLTHTDLEKIVAIEQALETRLGVKISLKKDVINVTKRFCLQRRAFRNLLKAHGTRVVVCVVAYSNSNTALIAAARDLGITTVEVQHGTLSPFHLGYHYPDQSSRYFCDYFLTFGTFWPTVASFPLSTDRIKTLGFDHLRRQLNTYTQTTRSVERSGVLWLSQGVVSSEMVHYAITTAQQTPQLHHIYKLHPSEYHTWRSDAPCLAQAVDQGLLTVIDNSQSSLYDLMWNTQYLIGVFSTAVYEGLSLGCYTFIIDLPGVEYMEALIEQGVVEFCRNPESLIIRLNENPQHASDRQVDYQKYFSSQLLETTDWLAKLISTTNQG